MHLLERYALNCGVKIDKPQIEEQFYPLLSDNFILLHPDSDMDSKRYDHYDEVINICSNFFKENSINIIQIGSQDNVLIPGCIDLRGRLSIRQTAYVVNKCKLLVGNDNFSAHIASGSGKKNVALYSTTQKECCFPYWTSSKNCSLLEPPTKKKPSFAEKEYPKSINLIKPEVIASSILNHLNINHDLDNYKTLSIGEYYNFPVIEVIPDFNALDYNINKNTLNVRMDYHFDENNLFSWSQNRDICVVTNRPISKECLRAIKPSLQQVIFRADLSTRPSDLATIKKIGTNLKVSTDDEENLNEIRYNLIDWEVELEQKKSKKDLDAKDDICYTTKYITSKITLSRGKKYASKAAWKQDIEMTSKQANIIDNNDFWEEVDHFMIFNYA